jgi:hypothetical protein
VCPDFLGFGISYRLKAAYLMKPILPLFTIAYAAVALLFAAAALVLVGFAFNRLGD